MQNKKNNENTFGLLFYFRVGFRRPYSTGKKGYGPKIKTEILICVTSIVKSIFHNSYHNKFCQIIG
jgi:hypothetical protein